MLHFALQSGGVSPIQDDQGEVGGSIFQGILLDGTDGQTQDVSLYVFNDDSNFKYNGPTLSIAGSDPVAQPSWFRFLDNKNVAGATPTESEWATFGVAGTLSMTLDNITQAGGLAPEKKLWLRVVVPAGIVTRNLSGIKLKVAAVEEAV